MTEVRTRKDDLSPEAIARLRTLVGDDPIPLPPGPVLPCDQCGCATPVVGEPTTVAAFSRAGDPPRPPGPRPELMAEFTRCPDCLARTEHAKRLVARFQSLPARWGPWGAMVKVENTLAALVVLGMDLPDPETVTAPVFGSLVHRLAGPGSGVAWAARFAPVQTQRPGTCAPRPWSGVPQSTRLALRTAYAATLADRMAASRPEQRIPPPEPDRPGIPVPGACLLCGIGTVTRTAVQVQALGGIQAAARQVWTPLAAPPNALGGSGYDPITGHVCPECAEAVDRTPAIGPTLLERAYSTYLRTVGRTDDADKVQRGEATGIVAWGAAAHAARRRSAPGWGPNAQPWGHLRIG